MIIMWRQFVNASAMAVIQLQIYLFLVSFQRWHLFQGSTFLFEFAFFVSQQCWVNTYSEIYFLLWLFSMYLFAKLMKRITINIHKMGLVKDFKSSNYILVSTSLHSKRISFHLFQKVFKHLTQRKSLKYTFTNLDIHLYSHLYLSSRGLKSIGWLTQSSNASKRMKYFSIFFKISLKAALKHLFSIYVSSEWIRRITTEQYLSIMHDLNYLFWSITFQID